MDSPFDLVAFAAHPDDIELTCGGTLARAAAEGKRVGMVDLTRGELGTRGTLDDRAREAEAARQALGVAHRENLGLPDAGISVTDETRRVVVAAMRRLRPRAVILPYWKQRHPDHSAASRLVYDGAYLAGLIRYAPDLGAPFRPHTLAYATAFHEVRPTFVVDISAHFEAKRLAVLAYHSQFNPTLKPGEELFPLVRDLIDPLEAKHRHYGSLIGVTYGEPFVLKEVLRIDDLTTLPVKSI